MLLNSFPSTPSLRSKPEIIILNGSLSEVPLISVAHDLGFRVLTAGNDSTLLGHRLSDEYVPIDYSDKERILEFVWKRGIKHIVSCANDFGVITASYVSDQLGLQGHDCMDNALLLHQKDRFKAYVKEKGITSPDSVHFFSEIEARSYIRNAEFPLIVKASDLTGGKGIKRADTPEQAIEAAKAAFVASRKKSIVIEPFIEGVQQSIDAFVVSGKVVSFVTNDTYMPINPYLIQSETLPARNAEAVQGELCSTIEFICKDLGLVDGMFTIQYILKDGIPYVIEAMRRCLGNQFLTVARASNGFPWEEALVRAESGIGGHESLRSAEPLAPFVGHHGIMAARNGTIGEVRIDPSLEGHVFHRVDILSTGDEITDFANQRVAYLYYRYDKREEIDSVASRLNELAQVTIQEGIRG